VILEEREKLVFEMLEKTKSIDSVLIGGYAINAYTLPRFSIGCDLVVKTKADTEKIATILKENGFSERKEAVIVYNGKFKSLEYKGKTKTTFDILWGGVLDRKTGVAIKAEKIFKNSTKRTVYGKGSPAKIECRTASAEMLIAMKILSSRKSNICDVFMLHSVKLDRSKLLELLKEINPPKQSLEDIEKTIKSTQFKDSLAGVYGKIQEEEFQSTMKKTLKTLKEA